MRKIILLGMTIFLLGLSACQAAPLSASVPEPTGKAAPETTPTTGLPAELLPAASTLMAATAEAVSMADFASTTGTASALLVSPILETPTPPSPRLPGEPAVPCLVEQTGLQPPVIKYPTITGDILAYLNAGAALADLDEALYDANVHSLPNALAPTDFNGDGWLDLVISVYDANSEAFPPPGKIAWYLCQGGQYAAGGELASGPDVVGGPHLWYWRDMDADGAEDIIVSFATCGASTCFDTFLLLSWNGMTLANRLDAPEAYPYPDAQVQDPDGDGIYELVIKVGELGSVGAGPQRSEIATFIFHPSAGTWNLDETTLGASSYRLHALHDADTFARQGDFLAALPLYSRVVSDDKLQDWNDPKRERLVLAAFSRFRMIQVYLSLGDTATAGVILSEQRETLPAGDLWSSYGELTQGYFDAFQVGGASAACPWAQEYAAGHQEQVLDLLGPALFGYANLAYLPADMCLQGAD